MRYIRRVWSPLILGSMIIMIGLTAAQVGLGPARLGDSVAKANANASYSQ
jgi:xanthine/uracil permease